VQPGLVIAWIAEAGVLIALLTRLARLVRVRSVLVLTLSSFALRIAVGEALYFVSVLHLPVLQRLQLPGGFWTFGYDGWLADGRAHFVYQYAGYSRPGTLRTIAINHPFVISYDLAGHPNLLLLTSFERLLTALYTVLGFNPSVGLLLVAAAAAACIPLAYLTAVSLGSSARSATLAAAVVGFWPSSLLWSGMLLKDSLQWFGVFALTAGCTWFFSRAAANVERRALVEPSILVLLGALVMALFRDYAAAAWLLGIILAAAIFVLQRGQGARAPALELTTALLSLLLVAVIPWGDLAGTIRQLPKNAHDIPAMIRTLGERAGTAAFSDAGSSTDPAASDLPVASPNSESPAPTVPPEYKCDAGVLCGRYTPDEVVGAASRTVGGGYERIIRAGVAKGYDPMDSHVLNAETRQTIINYIDGGGDTTPLPTPEPDTNPCPPLHPLVHARYGFRTSQAGSQTDSDVVFSNCLDVLAYVPRALELTFLAPLPNEWLHQSQGVGGLRAFTPLDTLLLWLLMPGLLVGFARGLRHLVPGSVLLMVYILALGLGLGFVVTIFGTLFRLRLQVVLPAVVLSVSGWSWLLAQIRAKAAVWRTGHPRAMAFGVVGQADDRPGLS